MDYILERILDTRYKKSYEYMSQCRIGSSGYRTMDHVFNFQKEDNNAILGFAIMDFSTRIHMPPELSCMYDILGSYDREILISEEWSLHSINHIENTVTHLQNVGQNDLIPIGIKNIGMGWSDQLFIDKNKKQMFITSMGGSNSITVRNNYRILLNYKTTNDKINAYITYINLDEFMNLVHKKN